MMEDIAMHILELIMNSIYAESKLIKLFIEDSSIKNIISFIIEDNGKGIKRELVKDITSPFITERKTRKVGMGLAFVKGLCDMCDGKLNINSREGFGTKIEVIIRKDHIDVPKMGDLGFVIMSAIQSNSNIRYAFTYKNDTTEFIFDSDDIKKALDDVNIDDPKILLWIKDYINQNLGEKIL